MYVLYRIRPAYISSVHPIFDACDTRVEAGIRTVQCRTEHEGHIYVHPIPPARGFDLVALPRVTGPPMRMNNWALIIAFGPHYNPLVYVANPCSDSTHVGRVPLDQLL